MLRSLSLLLLFLSLTLTAFAQEPVRREWNIEGTARAALVYAPADAKTKPAPVIFAFHGHGGTMGNAARNWRYHRLWPEAIVVYPQGLNTPGRLTDPDGKLPGWQPTVGSMGDRDLKFFDTILASLKADYRVDEKHLFVTGHSNGGGFTYLLWEARGDLFAAYAPCAAILPVKTTDGRASLRDYQPAADLKPHPVFHLAGQNDPLVKFNWQKLTIDALRRRFDCGEGQPWEQEKLATLYPSKIGGPIITYIHPGGHELPREAPAAITKFFKEQMK